MASASVHASARCRRMRLGNGTARHNTSSPSTAPIFFGPAVGAAFAQQGVAPGQGYPHQFRVRFPQLGAAVDVREQEGDDATGYRRVHSKFRGYGVGWGRRGGNASGTANADRRALRTAQPMPGQVTVEPGKFPVWRVRRLFALTMPNLRATILEREGCCPFPVRFSVHVGMRLIAVGGARAAKRGPGRRRQFRRQEVAP